MRFVLTVTGTVEVELSDDEVTQALIDSGLVGDFDFSDAGFDDYDIERIEVV